MMNTKTLNNSRVTMLTVCEAQITKCWFWIRTVSLALVLMACADSAYADPNPVTAPNPNCGVTSALALARVYRQAIPPDAMSLLQQKYPQSMVSMADVRDMTARLGMDVVGVKSQLDDLLIGQRPSIIHLTQPEHFVLLLDGDAKQLRLLEETTGISVVDRSSIEARFDGYALLPKNRDLNKDVPQVLFDDLDFSFGIIGAGQKVKHTFRFTNTGTQPFSLKIEETSCGCTGAYVGAENQTEVLLKQGESSNVFVFLDVQSSAGNVQQMVTLSTNDPSRKLIYLTLRGSVPQDLIVTPQSLLLTTTNGTDAETGIQIICAPETSINEAKTDNPSLRTKVELVEEDATKKVWYIHVLKDKDMPAGEFSSTVSITTNHPVRPTITVPIKGVVNGDLEVTPSRAFFGFVEKNAMKQMALTIQSQTGKEFKILGTTFDANKLPGIQVEKPDGQSASKHVLTCHLDMGQLQLIDGEIRVQTDVPGEETIVIPVIASVENAAEIAPDVDVSASPDQISLGKVVKGQKLRKNIIVQSRSEKQFSVQSSTSQSPLITVKASPDVVASAHAVEIDVKADGVLGSPIRETVKLTLSNGQILEIPIVGTISANEEMATTTQKMPVRLEVGQPAPDFVATDMNGKKHDLISLRGKKNLLLTFFPKCFTGGCANHLSSLRDQYAILQANDIDVLAVSVDPADGEHGQKAFAKQWSLPFPLIPDTERKLSMLYGAADQPTDFASRMTVLIDKKGNIRLVDNNVNVQTHGADMVAKMRDLGIIK